MSSSAKTSILGLNDWSGSDKPVRTDFNADNAAIDAFAAMFTGVIVPYAGSAAPAGTLLCDGSAVSRTTYARLFSRIGTAYGSGDGSTTFNLPNAKGCVLAGYDNTQTEFNTLGKTGGEKTHVLTTSEMPNHTHPTSNQWVDGATMGSPQNRIVLCSGGGLTPTVPPILSTSGGGNAHNNLQPYLTTNYIIFC